jgi:alkanesulfonate monooxygenase SsuD/methylene tetrahydromethanopterin reductase-like flavin-dependent oxidoreductase (luciferase family)
LQEDRCVLLGVETDKATCLVSAQKDEAPELIRQLPEPQSDDAAPEHSHIPVPWRTPFPGGGDVPKPYYEVMDPFVVLSAAAGVTKTLKLATGVCLVVQRDPIQTAKLVASIDQVSSGRFLFGVGGGWNAEEIEDHGLMLKHERSDRSGCSI